MITTWKALRRTKPVPGDGGTRKRLPATRPAVTRKISVNGLDVYVRLGMYPGSTVPAELFVTIGKAGSDIGGMFDALACMISVSLQYGVPWGRIVTKLKRFRFGLDPTDECPSILHAVIVAADGLAKDYAKANEETTRKE